MLCACCDMAEAEVYWSACEPDGRMCMACVIETLHAWWNTVPEPIRIKPKQMSLFDAGHDGHLALRPAQ